MCDEEKETGYVVWGAGNRGMDVLNALRNKNIVAVIDENKDFVGQKFRNVPIICFEDYLKRYAKCILIITPENYEKEIEQKLIAHKIFHYFLYQEGFLETETYLLQADREKLFAGYDIREKHTIYGLSLLGFMMYEDFLKRGFSCEVIPQENFSKQRAAAFADQFRLRLGDKEHVENLHLSMPFTEKDRIFFKDKKSDKFYDLIERDIFGREELKKFKNRQKGKRCFIVGTGPSLKIEDLDTLYRNREICIGTNGIYKAFNKTKWRPDYYMVGDLNAVYYGKKQILDMDVANKFVSDLAWDFGEGAENLYRWHLIRRWQPGRKPEFSPEFSKGTYAGLTITYDGALQFASYLGCSEIYLLGIDCSNYREKKTAHFFDRYGEENKSETGCLNIDANILAYMAAEEYSRKNGFRIYNATRGGMLEVFERKNFGDLFERKEK